MNWKVLLVAIALLTLAFSAPARASLFIAGSAQYGGNSYNLVYDTDQSLMWFDYSSSALLSWQDQSDWANITLNTSGVLTYILNPGYSLTGNWRLPNMTAGPYSYGYDGTTTAGYNITSAEMGHLFYTELGNKGELATNGALNSPYGLTNAGPFTNMQNSYYWSNREATDQAPNDSAWYFSTKYGEQDFGSKANINSVVQAMAVSPAQYSETSTVPEPSTYALLCISLGVVGYARKRMNKQA